MKNYFFLLTFLIGGLSILNAQCVPVSNNSPGIFPDSVLKPGCVNASYVDTFTIVAPLDTVVSGFAVVLDSAEVIEYIGVPAGLSFSCGANCKSYPSGPTPAKVCTEVSGSSNVILANYRVGIAVEAWVTIFANPMSFIDTVYVFLNIDTLDKTITVSSPMLTSNEAGATYQWLDCGNSYAIIPSETSQSYTAVTTGMYAVEITKNGCVDTSYCENVTTTDIESFSFDKKISVFPNPSNDGNFTIKYNGTSNLLTIDILDVTGKLIQQVAMTNSNMLTLNIRNNKGVYYLNIKDLQGNSTSKLITVN